MNGGEPRNKNAGGRWRAFREGNSQPPLLSSGRGPVERLVINSGRTWWVKLDWINFVAHNGAVGFCSRVREVYFVTTLVSFGSEVTPASPEVGYARTNQLHRTAAKKGILSRGAGVAALYNVKWLKVAWIAQTQEREYLPACCI